MGRLTRQRADLLHALTIGVVHIVIVDCATSASAGKLRRIWGINGHLRNHLVCLYKLIIMHRHNELSIERGFTLAHRKAEPANMLASAVILVTK